MTTQATPKHGYSEEELASLTQEERDGLLDESVVDDDDEDLDAGGEDDAAKAAEAAKQESDAKAAAEAAKAEEAAKAGDADAAAKKAADDATAAAAAKDGEGEGGKQPEPQPAASTFPKYEAPADAKAKLEDLTKREDALAAKFDDGELTAAEYRQQQRALDNDRDELKNQIFRAQLSEDAARAAWFGNTVTDFLSKHTQYEDGSLMYNALDREVRRLQTANAEEGKSQYDPAILLQAHQNIEASARKAFGVGPTTPTTPKPGEQKREIPPSIGGLPAADAEDTDGGEFAALDRLGETDPLAYERALEKMPDAKREQYLAQ